MKLQVCSIAEWIKKQLISDGVYIRDGFFEIISLLVEQCEFAKSAD